MPTDDLLSKPAVYEDPLGNIIYRASALGWCLNSLIYARLDYEPQPPPEYLQEKFDESSSYEQIALDRYIDQEHGAQQLRTYDTQVQVQIEVTSSIFIRGHIDAVVDYKPIEIKSPATFLYKKWSVRSNIPRSYLYQISCYILRRGPLHLVIANKEDENAPLVIHRFTEPPITMEEIRQRILSIEYQAASNIPQETCEYDMYPCPYFRFHTDDKKAQRALDKIHSPLDEPDQQHLQSLLNERREIKSARDALKDDWDNINREIKSFLRNRNIEEIPITVDGRDVTVKVVPSSSTTADWKAMEEDGIFIDNYKKKTFYSYVGVFE